MTTRWGLIGASQVAQQGVIPAIRLQPDCEVVSVYSTSVERGKAYAEQNQIPRSTVSLDELLADPTIDAVYISTTNNLHYEQVLAAAKAGKHILCEKPLALSVEQAQAMVKASQEAGVVFATNHHLRNAATHRKMRELIAQGRIGEPIAARVFHAFYLRESLQGWRINSADAGAGVVLDVMTHDIDILRYLLQSDPTEVTSFSQYFGMSTAAEDGSMAVFRFANNVIAQVHVAFTVPFAPNGLEIHGTKGSLFAKQVLQQTAMGEIRLIDQAGEQVIAVEHESIHGRSIRRFVDAILGQGEPAATGEDGLYAVAAALACIESARTGCKQAIII